MNKALLLLSFLSLNTFTISANSANVEEPQFRVKCGIVGGGHLPLLKQADYWSPYPSIGILGEVPTIMQNTSLRLAIEITELQCKIPYENDFYSYHSSLVLLHKLPFPTKLLEIKIYTGISNITVSPEQEFWNGIKNSISIGENEFGGILGIEPGIAFRRISIALPISIETIFNSPHPFVTMNVNLCIITQW
jgi:hypothetical protein